MDPFHIFLMTLVELSVRSSLLRGAWWNTSHCIMPTCKRALQWEGAMEASWANKAKGSQRNPGKNRDTGKCSVAGILTNVSHRWLNKAPTLYLNLLITCCTWPYTFYPHKCQVYWKEKYALNGIIHLHSHSFQFVSTAHTMRPLFIDWQFKARKWEERKE